MFGGVLNSLTRKLGQTATKSEASKLAGLIGGEGAIAKSAPKMTEQVADQIIYHGTPNKFTKFNNDGGSTWFTSNKDKIKDSGLSWNGQGELNIMERKLPSDLKLATRDLEDRYTRWELEGMGYKGIKYDDIGPDEIYYELFEPNKLPLNESVPEEAMAYLGGGAGGGNDLLKYMNATNPEFVAKKNLGAKTKSKRINVDEYSQRPQELQQQPVSRVFVSEQGQPISDMPTEVIKTDGGYIRILPNSPYAPENLTSIVKVMVDEGNRRQGIGSDLLKEAMRKYGRISAFAENEASQRMNYKLGMRPVDKPNATLEEVLALGRKQGGGVTMVTPARSEVNHRQFNKLGSGRPTNEIRDSIAGTKIHPDDMDAMDEFIRYARNKKLRNSLPDDKQAKYEMRAYDMAEHYGIKLNENATDPIRDMANRFIKAMDKQNVGGK